MKRLITAEVVRQEHARGQKTLEVALPQCILTPEARGLAAQLDMKIVETLGNSAAVKSSPPAACAVQLAPAGTPGLTGDLAKIRAEVIKRLPPGTASEALIEQLIQKLAGEQQAGSGKASGKTLGQADFSAKTSKHGIKTIAGDSIRFGLFEGAGREKQVGITDVVTAADGSSIAAGFMRWEKCFFPWTLTYDEIDYIVDGELHIRSEGETIIAKKGDVIFIPKNSSIEFGTPTQVCFMYVAYPANWQDA